MKFDFQPSILTGSDERKAFASYWFRRIFIDDWLMKIVAMLVTFALWLGVSGLRTPTTRTINNVSLITLVAKNLEITNARTPEIDIEVTGDKDEVNKIGSRQISATIDLTNEKEGDREISITPDNITLDLPNGVSVIRVNPEKIFIKLETVKVKEVPVRVEIKGETASGFEVYSKTAKPSRVKIRGPKSYIDTMSFVTTEKVDLANRETSFISKRIPLRVSDPKISFVGDVATVVNIEIGLIRTESIITVPYESGERSRRAVVTLFGPRVTLERLKSEDVVIAEQPDKDGNSILSAVLPEYASGILVKSVRRAGAE